MKIDKAFVEEANAKLQDLKMEAVLLNTLEQVGQERGYSSFDGAIAEHLSMLSNKFGRQLSSFDEVQQAVLEFENVLGIVVQTDYMANKFATLLDDPTDLMKSIEQIKTKHLQTVVDVLEMEL